MSMKPEMALRKLEEIETELGTLAGQRDRSTALGRRNHNRSSTLYRRRKNMRRIVREKASQVLRA